MGDMAEMSSSAVNDLPDSDFAYIEPGGTKDASGKTIPRSKRHFPVHDKTHVQNALSRAPQSPFGDKAMPKIKARAKKFGVDVSDDSSASREESWAPLSFRRDFPLQDISIRAGGDGRTVTAYATVFDTPVPIHDQQGDYIEVIERHAFDRILPKLQPQGDRKAWRCGVFYNHGMTLHATPSDRNSVPIGVPLEIAADAHGLKTVTRFHRGELADQILEAIKEGSLGAYSFSGRFDRSQPDVPRGGFRPDRYGNLPTVRRSESTLREYGPTPFPAYQDAVITGVRAEKIAEQLQYITELIRSGAPLDSPQFHGAPPDGDSLTDDLLGPEVEGEEEHSARYHQHALYLLRAQEQREKAGLAW
jgi:HK97 family phage prohead protease